MENIIEIKNLDKSFKEVHAVNDLSFNVKRGGAFRFSRSERRGEVHYDIHYVRHAQKR
jgi:hypothetical protein